MEKYYHVKKNDLVIVTTGKDKGKTGKILRIAKKKDRLIVEKVNMVKKHVKPSQKTKGGIMEKESLIHVSNVMIFCEKCSKPVRVGKKILEDGNKVRFCKKCNEVIDK
ncbi:MAG: 50S ribosomal protein L24 [Proteobacteria bacterium]|nr:50S ribosomal protein L24 [Pseudomonadota bacterium]